MINRIAVGIFGVILLMRSASASEPGGFQYESTEKLLDQCTLFLQDKTDTKFEPGRCAGYIEAIADVNDCKAVGGEFAYDVPNGTSVYQIVVAVSRWLVKHPEAVQYSASSNIRIALRESFPCR